MITYKDMTFCSYWKECAASKPCPRKLTDAEKTTADLLGLQIAQFAEHPDCFIDVLTNTTNLPKAGSPGKTPARPPFRGSGTFAGKCWQCGEEAPIYDDSELCQACDKREAFSDVLQEISAEMDITECPFCEGEELLDGCLQYGICVKCENYKGPTTA